MAKEIQITNTVYECEKCGTKSYSKSVAENCCKVKHCDICNSELLYYNHLKTCDSCREKQWFKKANKILPQDYKEDMVYFKENYHYSIEDCLDDMSKEDFDNVTYIQGCEKERHILDYDNIITDFETDTNIEDYQVDKQGIKELRDFLEQWNEKYGVDSYYPSNVAILIDEDFKKGYL